MAKKQARTEFQRGVDDVLTEAINNNRQAREFILRHTGRMAKEIEDRFGSDLVQVYIKGKSSLKLKKLNDVKANSKEEHAEEIGWSDFDNQIIINPYIPRAWWYEIFNQIHCYIRDEYLPSVRDLFFVDYPEEVPAGGYLADHMQRVPFGEKIEKEIGFSGPEATLLHAKKMQSNVLLCLAQEYLHPLNAFDNTRTVFAQNLNLDINFMKEKFREANNFFPPSVIVLKDKNGKKIKKDSSVWMNCTIGKFLLYRLIVRYSAPGVDYNGVKIRDDVGVDRAKFRGEVIDISIPRRESEETINYWRRFKDDLRGLNNTNTYMRSYISAKKQKDIDEMRAIRIPGWAYQLQENVMMLHEVLTYSSNSAHKFYKRLERAWPALSAIQESSEKDSNSPLNANLFKFIGELKANYDAYQHKPAIQSFYKQLGSILINDYQWDKLSPTLKTELLTKFLPNTKKNPPTYQKEIENMLINFNVEKDGKDAKNSAKNILLKAFSVDESKFKDKPKEALIAAKKASAQAIENYEELLKHLFIVNKSNQAFGEKFKLNMKQIEQINHFRLALEGSCNTKVNCWDEKSKPQKSQKEIDSHKKIITTQVWGLGIIEDIGSLSDGLPFDSFNQGLVFSDEFDSSVKEKQEDAVCYFCGIIGSQLDLVGRMHLKDAKDLAFNYYFPVVQLYLKCSKQQWAELPQLFKDKSFVFSKDYFTCEDKRFGDHVIQVNFVDQDEEKKCIAFDQKNADLEKQLVSKRVNDRLEINTLCHTADEAYSFLEHMNAKLMQELVGLRQSLREDETKLSRLSKANQQRGECIKLTKIINGAKDIVKEIEDCREHLINLYIQMHFIRSLLDTADKKGHIRDLQNAVVSLGNAIDEAIKQAKTNLYDDKNSADTLNAYGVDKAQVHNLMNMLAELKKLITAITLNSPKTHKKPADLNTDLKGYAEDYEAGQKALIFARQYNDRNLLIGHLPYRILREEYINEYFHLYIGQLRDFYLLHWLDHERTQYKANITNFKTQLTRWRDKSQNNETH
ncbi:hypothetical protein MED121_16624 [Marinomonas sp. MED121]|uniref:hypothetical protein n=1 Tax=Marinomonas sp. MED121 TaxID=314277 RepID=UPI0000691183|nr:hypothetical protein [Marinomonas sp. MED121]EAQ67570.1 hypothetical protein MED121_16624 [Marinomonas sp. MED121]